MNQTMTALLLCVAALTLPSYDTLAQPPARKAHAKWVKGDDNDWSESKPRGKYEETDDGAVVTLPNGHQYITKRVDGEEGPLAVLLVFPNRQVFSSETAKGAVGPAFVNEDETLIAVTCHPATQTGDLHIYTKEPNGKFRGENGYHHRARPAISKPLNRRCWGVSALAQIPNSCVPLNWLARLERPAFLVSELRRRSRQSN